MKVIVRFIVSTIIDASAEQPLEAMKEAKAKVEESLRAAFNLSSEGVEFYQLEPRE